jgi:hypothetical protein
MWIGKDVTGSFHDKFEILLCIKTDVKLCCLDLIQGDLLIAKMLLEAITTNFRYNVIESDVN